ncbi:metallophosphoesterase family protein [Alkalicoccus luteus]|uniref:Phosphoesterase n=1 Tax=Alkalicoccus luteus TaxID=1237094 RepID=A0A969PR87_9BACI|nr:YfcE family phosphodiesterase [Alkalicoccus luteus]NJP38945.1 YfcE family phosphodiesterase [Alkalicoccus luteus]
MEIVIFGDTHTDSYLQLPSLLRQSIEQADLLVHTGDWDSVTLYQSIAGLGIPLFSAAGNADPPELQSQLGKSQRFEAGGWRFGVVHGHEGTGKSTEERAKKWFSEDMPDIVCFGHSHIPYLRYHSKTLLLNPGSAVYRRRVPHRSAIRLLLKPELEVQHVFL